MNFDPDRPFDVAIAGAGLVGTTLALRLARKGVKVALLDPGKFPRDKLCGEYLSPEGAAVLDRLGLTEKIRNLNPHTIHRVRLTTPRGSRIEADVVGPENQPGLGLSRSALDELLIRETRLAGVAVFEQTRVALPIIEAGNVVGLDARSSFLGPIPVRAKITIAANGRHSFLVRSTGVTRTRSRFRSALFGLKRHLIATENEAAEPVGTVGLHLVPGGYVGACRVDGGVTNLCGLLPESLLKQHRGDLNALVNEHFSHNSTLDRLWQTSQPSGEWKTVANVRVEVSTPVLPGIFYVGDCQGTVDPLGGQGMTMALRGAETLTPTILAALGDHGADRSRQDQWQKIWRRRFDRRITLCRAFHHVLTRPGMLDLASHFGSFADRAVGRGFALTRDRG